MRHSVTYIKTLAAIIFGTDLTTNNHKQIRHLGQ